MGNENSTPNGTDDRNPNRNPRRQEPSWGEVAFGVGAGVTALYYLSSRDNPNTNANNNFNHVEYVSEDEYENNELVIYTDASCDVMEGDAGVAGYVQENHPLNFQRQIGFCRNAKAEVIADIQAIEKFTKSSFVRQYKIVTIKTDFKQLAEAMTKGFNPNDNGGIYQYLQEKIEHLRRKYLVDVEFMHIPRKSESGNRKADRMANEARRGNNLY